MGPKTIVVESPIQSIHGILGSVSTPELLSKINEKFRSYTNENFIHIKDTIERGSKLLMEKIIKPQERIKRTIQNTLNSLKIKNENNVYRPLITEEDMRNIPPIMYDSILRYKPVKLLHRDNRIFGFGIEPNKVPSFDIYHRLVHNGETKNLFDPYYDDHEIKCVSIWRDTDPDLSFEELDAIEWTRIYIDYLLDKQIDPTDYPGEIA